MKSMDEFEFVGLIGDRPFAMISGPEFDHALARIGWRLGSDKNEIHFLRSIRGTGADLRAHTCGIHTPNDLANSLRKGETEPGRDGKKIRNCVGPNGRPFLVVYRDDRTPGWLITFSFPGKSDETRTLEATCLGRVSVGRFSIDINPQPDAVFARHVNALSL